MQIYLNDVRWISKVSSNAKYPYSQMEVGDKAVIVPRRNIPAHKLHFLDHSVRASAYAACNNGGVRPQQYAKTFSTRKVWLTDVSPAKIGDRPAFQVTRVS